VFEYHFNISVLKATMDNSPQILKIKETRTFVLPTQFV